MTVLITLTLAGSDTGPFDLYSDADGYTSPFLTGISRATLIAGFTTSAVPNNTTEILVKSTGVCQRDLYLNVAGAYTTTTTTSTSSSTTTTTSSTTTLFPEYILAQIGFYADTNGCPLVTALRIYLDASDYALFVANSNQFGGIGGGPTTCTVIARNSSGFPITAKYYDSDNVCWDIVYGGFTYNAIQC